MSFDLAFVDSIASVPVVRLQLNDSSPIKVVAEETDFGTPDLNKARSATLMADGALISGSAYGNRMLRIKLQLPPTDKDAAATAMQNVARELNRETNILRYRAGTTAPVFFLTARSEVNNIDWDGVSTFATIDVEAWSYAVGLEEVLPTATIYNDPTEGPTLNANPYFEVDASNWAVVGGTFVRSTAQFHEGAASGLMTPNGVASICEVTSEHVAVTPNSGYRASAWVRCAVARNITIGINWYTGANAFISDSLQVVAVAANTWTYVHTSGTAPGTAGLAALVINETGTPPAGNTLHIDQARIGAPIGGQGAMFFDVTGIKGDADTPLYLRFGNSIFGSNLLVNRRSVIAARRRGTPSQAPFVLPAESMNLGTDVTLPGNDQTASGGGSNYARVSGWTNTNLVTRLTADPFPPTPSQDLRGQYKAFARIKGLLAGTSQFQLKWGTSQVQVFNDVAVQPDVTNAQWGYVELGTVSWPMGVDPETDRLSGVPISSRGQRIELAISKGSATNTDVDFLLFMPADDLLCTISWQADAIATTAMIDSLRRFGYFLSFNGEVRPSKSIGVRGGAPFARPGVTNRYYLLIDLEVQTNVGGDLISDITTVTPSYYPLYLGIARPPTS